MAQALLCEKRKLSMTEYPRTIIIPHAYPVVEAALQEFLSYLHMELPKFKFSRQVLTSGSCRYPIITKVEGTQRAISAFVLRMISDQQTLMRVEFPPEYASVGEGFILVMLSFPAWMERDQEIVGKLAKQSYDLKIPPDTAAFVQVIMQEIPDPEPTKPAGRHEDKDNKWARGELAKGQDRKEVRAEYFRRKGLDPTDPASSDRFRKAIGRTKRT